MEKELDQDFEFNSHLCISPNPIKIRPWFSGFCSCCYNSVLCSVNLKLESYEQIEKYNNLIYEIEKETN